MKLYDFGHATFVWGKSTVHVQDALSRINAAEPWETMISKTWNLNISNKD